MDKRHKTLTVETPEGITFPLVLADPVRRCLALVLDQLIIILLAHVAFAAGSMLGFLGADIMLAFVATAQFIITIGYNILLEWAWRGQTVGKRVFKIRVMDSQGLRLQFSQILIRNLMRFLDMLPLYYLVGGVSCWFSRRGQRVGDMLANTIVVFHPRIVEPDLAQLLPDKFNSFREHPHLAARLRQTVSPQEAGIILNALMRRDILEDRARIDLFQALREHLEEAVRFPEAVTDGLSDEQYVRNAADVIYR